MSTKQADKVAADKEAKTEAKRQTKEAKREAKQQALEARREALRQYLMNGGSLSALMPAYRPYTPAPPAYQVVPPSAYSVPNNQIHCTTQRLGDTSYTNCY